MLFRHMDDTVCNNIDYDYEDSEKKMMMIMMIMDIFLRKKEVSDHQGTRKISTKKHLVSYYLNYKVK